MFLTNPTQHIMPSTYWLVVLIAGIASIAAIGSPALACLHFDAQAISAGEWWRVCTYVLAHVNLTHAANNCIGAIGCYWLYSLLNARRTFWLVVLLIPLLCAGVFLTTNIVASGQGVAGFSGVLYGLVAAMIVVLGQRRSSWAAIIAIGLCTTLLLSFFDIEFSPLAAHSLHAGHGIASICGVLLGLLSCGINPGRKRAE